MPIPPDRIFLEKNILTRAQGRTLLVGVRDYCRYEKVLDNCETLDIDPETKPDYVADICDPVGVPRDFDTIICYGVLRYASNPFRAIEAMKGLLRVGGKLLLGMATVVAFDGFEKYGGDKWRFTLCGARHLLKDFEITWEVECDWDKSRVTSVEAIKK